MKTAALAPVVTLLALIVGIFELYRGDFQAWTLSPGTTATIDFAGVIVSEVEFFAVGLDGAEIRAFGSVNEPAIVDVSGADINLAPLLRFTGSITGIEFENAGSAFAAIDDFGFSTVPEPAGALLILGGLLALCRLESPRSQAGTARSR